MTIGEKIRAERVKRGWTQKTLGEKCKMADSAIRRYELDRGNPTIGTLKRIAMALGVDTWDLLSDEDLKMMGITEEVIRQYKEEVAIDECLDEIAEHLAKLNHEGQRKAVERVEELTEIPKYQNKKPPQD